MRLVLIPGFMQRGSAWRPVAELLGERPGEGLGERPGEGLRERLEPVLLDHAEHTFEGRLREIEEAAGPAGAVLAGYSLGGRLALRAALRDPARYAAVVMVGATAGIEDPAERAARAEADARLAAWIETRSIEDVVGVWERQPLFADQPDTLVEEQRAGRLDHDPRDLATLLLSAGQGPLEPVWHALERLDLPLLAIAGARDERYAEAAGRLARAAPRGRVAIVEGAGHAPQLQRPDAVARLIEGLAAALRG